MIGYFETITAGWENNVKKEGRTSCLKSLSATHKIKNTDFKA